MKAEIKITRIVDFRDVINVFFSTIDDVEKFFVSDVVEALSACDFKPVLPSELLAKRSIIITKLDKIIYEHSSSAIKSEIEKCNTNFDVKEVIKFTNQIGMKIVFSSAHSAVKALSSGVHLFMLHIPGKQMKPEVFTKINTCYRCYAVDGHFASNCPKGSSYKVCANCASHSHVWNECSSEVRRCINCEGDHHAMSMVCKVRREVQKAGKFPTKDYPSYANIVKTGPSISPLPVHSDIIAKSITCVILASMKNIDNPDSFGDELNKLLQLNDMPTLNLAGFVPPSLPGFQRKSSALINDKKTDEAVHSSSYHSAGPGSSRQDESNSTVTGDEHSNVSNLVQAGPSRQDENISAATTDEHFNVYNLAKPGPSRQDTSNVVVNGDLSWCNKRVYKLKSKNIRNSDELLAAFEDGSVVITNLNGNVVNYLEVSKLILKSKLLPKFIELKKSDFASLSNSPARYLRSRVTKAT